MQKEVKLNEGKIVIYYCEASQDISSFVNEEFTETVYVNFIPNPNIKMTEKRCLEYTNENMDEIVKEIKIVISENYEFYKNFNISFCSNFSTYYSYKDILTNNIIVMYCTLHINSKIKSELLVA